MYDADKWNKARKSHGRNTLWIKCKLSNGENIFCPTHKEWVNVKAKCDSESLTLTEWSLQSRSHEVKVDIDKDAEGVYFARSLMGIIGGNSLQYYTTGIIKGDRVYKKLWLIPELIVDRTANSSIEECFPQTLIRYHEQEKKNS